MRLLDLQMFAEEEQPKPSETASNDPTQTFETLVNGPYKAEFDQRVQAIVQDRLKNQKQKEAQLTQQLQQYEQVVRDVADKYAVDHTNVDELKNKLNNDDRWYEDEADRTGVDVEIIKKQKLLEQQNKQLQEQIIARQKQEQQAQFNVKLRSQEFEAKQQFPQLDLNAEMQNEQFRKLIQTGVPVKNAYLALHGDEIVNQTAQSAAQEAQEKVVNGIKSRNVAPQENPVRPTAPQPQSSDTNDLLSMTQQQRDAYLKDVKEGRASLPFRR